MSTSLTQTAAGPSAGYGDGREALLRATTKIVAEKGLRGLTYRAICEEAGVAHGLIRYYFGSWDELVKQAFLNAMKESLSDTGMQHPITSLEQLGHHLIDAVLVDLTRQSYQYEMVLQALRQEDLRPLVAQVNADYREAIQLHLDQAGLGGDPILTNLVYVAFDGIVLELLTLGDRALAEASLARLRQVLAAYQSHILANSSGANAALKLQ